MLVELEVEGRKAEVVHYVGQVQRIEEDGHHLINFLRISSHFTRDLFRFPAIKDELRVVRS